MYVVSEKQTTPLDIKPSQTVAKSERAELVGTITDHLNLDRKAPYKPLTYARVGMLLAHIPTKDLYYIRDYKDAKCWSKWVWWSIKKK